MPAHSIPRAHFLSQLTLVAPRVHRTVGKTSYLNPVHLPGGDSQRLYKTTTIWLFPLNLHPPVGWRGCERLQANQNLCEVIADGFILGANRHAS